MKVLIAGAGGKVATRLMLVHATPCNGMFWLQSNMFVAASFR